jgi:hypothetical protein
MNQMIYDQQPQMVEAAREAIERGSGSHNAADNALFHSFAAIDREALIEKFLPAYRAAYVKGHPEARCVAEGFVAAGIIPEREPDTHPKTESTMGSYL